MIRFLSCGKPLASKRILKFEMFFSKVGEFEEFVLRSLKASPFTNLTLTLYGEHARCSGESLCWFEISFYVKDRVFLESPLCITVSRNTTSVSEISALNLIAG